MDCPRCGVTLTPGEIEGVELTRCPSCEGVLLLQARMIPLLSKLSGPLAEEVDIDAEIAPVAPHAGDTACPECGRAMSVNGYMGTRIAHVTVCTRCHWVWLDPEALHTIAVLYARTDKRVDRIERTAQARAGNDTLVDNVLRGRTLQRRLFRLLNIH